jgi:mannose-1-phosphate guanylyltransferase
MNVMLLAAGEGTRLNPYTLQVPKPAIPFLTAPLAAYSLALLENIKIHNLVVNTHHLPAQIEDLFFRLYPACKKLLFSPEKEQLLGSGGGIHFAKSYLRGRENFLVMNADEVILPHDDYMMEIFIEAHEANGGIATLLTTSHPEVGKKFGGAWTVGNNEVQLFSKTKPGSNFQGHHFIGPMILNDRIFHYFKNGHEVENILYETLTKAIASGEKVYVHSIECEWHETGNPSDFILATKLFTKLLREKPNHPASQFLTRTIQRFGTGKTLIENEDSGVLAEVTSLLKLISTSSNK